MALNLLALANSKRTDKIGLSIIAKHDILPWLASAVLFLLIFVAIKMVIGSANPSVGDDELMMVITSRAKVLYVALIVLAVLCARRSRSVWTWVLSVILIIFFLPQSSLTVAIWLMPASVLQPLIAMIGFLAAERIVEYIRLRYVMDIEKPTLSGGALAAYILLVIGAIYMVTPVFI